MINFLNLDKKNHKKILKNTRQKAIIIVVFYKKQIQGITDKDSFRKKKILKLNEITKKASTKFQKKFNKKSESKNDTVSFQLAPNL